MIIYFSCRGVDFGINPKYVVSVQATAAGSTYITMASYSGDVENGVETETFWVPGTVQETIDRINVGLKTSRDARGEV